MLSKVIKKYAFGSSKAVPVVDISNFLQKKGNYIEDCKAAADAFHKYGCLIIKNPKVKFEYNEAFLDMMEGYFLKRSKQLYSNQKVDDVFPELGFQTGATPEFKEIAKNHKALYKKYAQKDMPDTPQPPPADAKWRYFWRIGQRPEGDRTFDPPKHIPKDIPDFEFKMDQWGNLMLDSVEIVSRMVGLGFGIGEETIPNLIKGGPHLLAPTGSDLEKYTVGTVFAGFHYDFNYITIHGKSRFPGLFIWLRNGEKLPVKVPDGCLLLQAGKQFEIITGGYVNNGYHEVIYTDEVLQKKNEAVKNGRIPWRVSSTLFSHIRYDVNLQPLDKFLTEETKKKYPPIKAYEYVEQELKEINLAN